MVVLVVVVVIVVVAVAVAVAVAVVVVVVVEEHRPAQVGFIIDTPIIIEIWGLRGVPPFRACLEVTF